MYITARVRKLSFRGDKPEYIFHEDTYSCLKDAEKEAQRATDNYKTPHKVFKLEEICGYSIPQAVRTPPKE